nr:hypothetical protein [Steroidobacter cummioxidans]
MIDFSAALSAMHAVVERARQHHVTQAELEIGGGQMRIPRAHGAMVVIEDADHFLGQEFGLAQGRVRIGPRGGAGRRNRDITEVRFLAGASRRSRNVQTGSHHQASASS